MGVVRISDSFNQNLFQLKIFGLWPGRTPSKYYKYFAIPYVFITYFVYFVLLTLNLMYTPWDVELLIREVTFYFMEIGLHGKVSMFILKRKQILEAFGILDCELFEGDDAITKKIISDSVKTYSYCWKALLIFGHIAFSILTLVPLLMHVLFGAEINLPICKYYFLSDETREKYFMYLFVYQAVMYGHMYYILHSDSLISGLMLHGITQLKIMNYKLINVKLDRLERKENQEIQDKILYTKLINCLKRYDVILKYFSVVQEIINTAIFMVFSTGAAVICVILCGLKMLPTTENTAFLVCYHIYMTAEIFVPSWLGSWLTYENQALVYAAYNSDWISSTAKFKRSLRLFVERANSPMVLRGMKMFPLALGTFISIMKLSWSSFTLVNNVHNKQNRIKFIK